MYEPQYIPHHLQQEYLSFKGSPKNELLHSQPAGGLASLVCLVQTSGHPKNGNEQNDLSNPFPDYQTTPQKRVVVEVEITADRAARFADGFVRPQIVE
jgi:hypothetical protein